MDWRKLGERLGSRMRDLGTNRRDRDAATIVRAEAFERRVQAHVQRLEVTDAEIRRLTPEVHAVTQAIRDATAEAKAAAAREDLATRDAMVAEAKRLLEASRPTVARLKELRAALDAERRDYEATRAEANEWLEASGYPPLPSPTFDEPANRAPERDADPPVRVRVKID